MNSKLPLFFVCICLCLTMSGCQKEESYQEETVQTELAASVENGTLSAGSTALSVGKTAVTYEEYRVYKYLMESRYESVFGDEVWKFVPEAGGNTIGQDAIEDVLRLIIRVKVINKEAARQNVTLAADEKEEADTSASVFCEKIPENVRKEKGIQTALVSRIFEENRLAEKMYHIVTGNAGGSLTDAECEAARVQLIWRKANDTNREEVRKTMVQLQNRTKSGGSFYRLARENTQADAVEYLIGRKDGRTTLVNAVLSLKEGEVSDIIEEKDGFYLAFCVEQDKKSVRREYRDEMEEDMQNEAFADAYRKWAGAYEVKASRSLLTE